MKKVCICIPVYNGAKTIAATLRSLLAQTYTDFELHVVDNHSTDNSLEVVRGFDDPRIHIHTHDVTVSGEDNFNRCIALASGEYTGIFHADDIYSPTMLEKQVQVLDADPAVGVVLTRARLMDDAGKHFKISPTFKALGFSEQPVLKLNAVELLKATMRAYNFLFTPSALVRTSIYQQEIRHWNGGDYKSSADLDVWLRIASQHKLAILNEPLLSYRRGRSHFSYAYNALRTEPADFFLIVDDWSERPNMASQLNEGDHEAYRALKYFDALTCAFNALLAGETTQGKAQWLQAKKMKPHRIKMSVKKLKYDFFECLIALSCQVNAFRQLPKLFHPWMR